MLGLIDRISENSMIFDSSYKMIMENFNSPNHSANNTNKPEDIFTVSGGGVISEILIKSEGTSSSSGKFNSIKKICIYIDDVEFLAIDLDNSNRVGSWIPSHQLENYMYGESYIKINEHIKFTKSISIKYVGYSNNSFGATNGHITYITKV